MPWKECHVMDERLRFVARLLEGEKMAPLCAEFGISRRLATKFSIATKIPASPPLPIGAGGASAGESVTRADRGDNRPLKREYPGWARPRSRKTPERVHRPAPAGHQHGPRRPRSARARAPSAPATPRASGPRSHGRPNRMPSGVPTIKANLCSAIVGIVIR